MTSRPYVIVSCAQSFDGYIDDVKSERLLLSNEEDLNRVDGLRASVDAILVGAGTVRRDNPRLLVRSSERRAERMAYGLPSNPMKVTIVAGGGLSCDGAFFTEGSAQKLVYTIGSEFERHQKQLGKRATVVSLGLEINLGLMLSDLADRGVKRLLVEGGSNVLAQFLASGMVDELRLATANFFVGEQNAPRFAGPGSNVLGKDKCLKLQSVEALSDVVVAHYISPDLDISDHKWLAEALTESCKCPPSAAAYSVGAIIVGSDGKELARGYSRETDSKVHAEEAAIAKLTDRSLLRGATIYSTLEPCSARVSRPEPCVDLIVDAGVARVVYAISEPQFLQRCKGAGLLRQAGIGVRQVNVSKEFEENFCELNHLVYNGGASLDNKQ
jgi:riboflavin-specific deaminase-like protein